MIDVAIQIVSYKSKKFLPACIESIIDSLKDGSISYRILILENDQDENLSDLENAYKDKPVSIYYSGKNVGFGAGHNILASKEDSKYIFALNPDTIIAKDAIGTLFSFMEQNPKAGVCGPRFDEPIGFWWHKKTFWPRLFVKKSFFERYLRIKIMPKMNVLEYSPIFGAAMFFRREAFKDVDGFDEHFFLYFEEGDICNSLKVKGWKTFFVYDACITHFYQRSDTRPGNKEIFEESKRYFFQKWPHGGV